MRKTKPTQSIPAGILLIVGVIGISASRSEADELDFLLGDQTDETILEAPSRDEPETNASSSDDSTGSEIVETVPVEFLRDESIAESASAPTRSRFVEEIRVTAERREAAMQDVPIAIQAFSAEALDARGITTLMGLSDVSPGLTISAVSGLTNTYLRGVGSDAFIPSADASVGMYVDGIYQPFSPAAMQNFGQVQRVEVLKGPQGTLFGRNTTGGAINVISEVPGEQFSASTQFSVESFNTRRYSGSVSGPVARNVYASASLLYMRGDTYYEFAPDSPVQSYPLGEQELGARVRLRWAPTNDFDIILTGLSLHTEGATASISEIKDVKPLGAFLGVEETEESWVHSTDGAPIAVLDNKMAYGEMNWQPSWFDVKLMGSTQLMDQVTTTDFDGSAVPLVFFSPVKALPGDKGAYTDTQTAEFQLLSNESGWMAERLKWIAGLYFFQSDQGFGPLYGEALGSADLLGTLVNSPLPIPGQPTLPSIPLLNALLDLAPDVGARLRLPGRVDTRSLAVYMQATYDVFDWMSVALGGRYTDERRELTDSGLELLPVGSSTPIPVTSFSPPPARASNFSPRVALQFRINPDIHLYASWEEAFKSGTFNSVVLVEEPDFVEPEELTAFEVGAKLDLFDRRLRLNVAAFENRIDNLQTQFISLLSGGVTALENAANARIRGVEMESTWSVTPSLVLTLAGTYLDAEFRDYPDGSGFNEETGFFQGGQDFSGNRITRTPKYVIQGGVGYTFNVPLGEVEFGGNVHYNDGYFYDNQNLSAQPSFTKVGARVSYLYEPWNVRLTLFGNNLTDAKVDSFQYVNDFGVIHRLEPPRTVGLRARWSW